MKVLIAGGGGYIGSHCAWYLVRGGHVPVVLDNWTGGRADRVEGMDVVTADADDRSKARIAFEHFKFDALLFSVAPRPVPRPARQLPEQLCPTLLGSGVVLAELCARFGVQKVIVLSSGAVYGQTDPAGVSEEAPQSPCCLPGEVAVSLERVFRCYAGYEAFALTVLRLFNVAGAEPEGTIGEERFAERHLIPTCLKALRDGSPFTLWGDNLPTPDGSAVRDFVHVLDVAEAVRLSLERPSPPRLAVYNVCSGTGRSVREILAAGEAVAQRTLTVEAGGPRENQVAWRVGSPRRIREELGWEQRHSSLEEILQTQWVFLQARGGEDAPAQKTAPGEASSAELFGEVAVKLGFVGPQDVKRALAIQREDAKASKPRRLLGLVMLEEGIITNAQLIEILRYYEKRETGDDA